jgi:hypothetical protein
MSGPPLDHGKAGASARAEYERRSARHKATQDQRIADDNTWRATTNRQHPLLGRVATSLTARPTVAPEPSHVRSWAVGEPGEVRVGAVLDAVAGIEALHDRRMPHSRANIDHIAVCPGAIWVIDAKRYVNKRVERRDVGGLFRTDERLFVGGRDHTGLAVDMGAQVQAVTGAVGDLLPDGATVRAALCFVESNWAWMAKPFFVRGVTVTWPRALSKILTPTGPIDPDRAADIVAALARALPPARRS